MRHLHAPELNHFNTKFLEAEYVLEVFKIERDIKDLLLLNSKCIRRVRSIYSFEPKSTYPVVAIMHPLHKNRTIP